MERRSHRKTRRNESEDPFPNDHSDAQVHRLQAILLAYLQAANYPSWPGADGLMLEDAIHTYPQAILLGLVPSVADLCELHPDLIAALPRLLPHEERGEK